jgi:hypothetical protein
VARRKGPPCVECGWEGCRSSATWACWVRCLKRALREHQYERSLDATVALKKAGVAMLMGAQTSGGEANYAPKWAIDAWKEARRLRTLKPSEVQALIREDARNVAPSPELTARLDELRAFAALRGWRFQYGTWYR